MVLCMDHARKNQDTYDRVAARYLERGRDRSLLRPLMRRFRERLPVNGPVLDLGAVVIGDERAALVIAAERRTAGALGLGRVGGPASHEIVGHRVNRHFEPRPPRARAGDFGLEIPGGETFARTDDGGFEIAGEKPGGVGLRPGRGS